MKKALCLSIAILTAFSSLSWAIPTSITYQGSLKKLGASASGDVKMSFRITNSDGTQVYWSSGDRTVSVGSGGLFSTQLSPTGVDWQNVIPYMEVSVDGQQLSPREAITATVYASMSKSIIDGAVTPAKVTSGYGLVPAGAIMMFESGCPTGWSVFSKLQGKFPAGEDPGNSAKFKAGQSGGSISHSHTIPAIVGTITSDLNNGKVVIGDNPTGWAPYFPGESSSSSESLPPYYSVIFCQKI